MRRSLRVMLIFVFGIQLWYQPSASAQSVLNPNDPVLDTTAHLPKPVWGQIGKWMRTRRLGWNTNSFKAYIYKDNAFRLKFPRTYSPVADGKKYPVFVFFHGLGEEGDIYDNEFQLYNGGYTFSQAVDNGSFDAFLLYMQSPGFFGEDQYKAITEIIDYMVLNNKMDPFRIYVDGVSAGGQATWEMTMNHPTYVSCASPISAVSILYNNSTIINALKFTPVWLFQGGKDGAPAPATAHQVRDAFLSAGANFQYKEYSTLGHICWDSAWAEPAYFPFLLRAYASNPWPLFGKTELRVGEKPLTIGLPIGFDGYEWRRNGLLINGAHVHTLEVSDSGLYDARVLKGGIWSDWSHTPVKVKLLGSAASTVHIYPVPFHDAFTLSVSSDGSENMSVFLYGADGRLMEQRAYTALTPGTALIHIQPDKALKPGLYLVKVMVGNDFKVLRLLKQ